MVYYVQETRGTKFQKKNRDKNFCIFILIQVDLIGSFVTFDVCVCVKNFLNYLILASVK